MSRSRKLNKIKFHSINRDVKAAQVTNSYNAIEIGRQHFVSRETVNAVRRAGTWPQWEQNKAELNRKRIERAKKAIDAPRTLPEPIDDSGEEDMVTITRSRFHNFVLLDSRVKTLEDWRDRQFEAEKARIDLSLNDQPKARRSFWSKR